jgi:hypothetical protein
MTMILPKGFTSHPARPDDAKAVADLINACAVARTGQVEVDAAGLGNEWQSPGFRLETDTRLIHAPDASPVGCATLWDREPHVLLRASPVGATLRGRPRYGRPRGVQ